jgi:hypothetical protein
LLPPDHRSNRWYCSDACRFAYYKDYHSPERVAEREAYWQSPEGQEKKRQSVERWMRWTGARIPKPEGLDWRTDREGYAAYLMEAYEIDEAEAERRVSNLEDSDPRYQENCRKCGQQLGEVVYLHRGRNRRLMCEDCRCPYHEYEWHRSTCGYCYPGSLGPSEPTGRLWTRAKCVCGRVVMVEATPHQKVRIKYEDATVYCGSACSTKGSNLRQAAIRAERRIAERVMCPCGNPIEGRRGARYCSGACRQKAYRQHAASG